VALAGVVREIFQNAQAAYAKHVSEPLRRRVEALVERSKEFDRGAQRRLKEQNLKHQIKFGKKSADAEPEPVAVSVDAEPEPVAPSADDPDPESAVPS